MTGSWKRFLVLLQPFRLVPSIDNARSNISGDIVGKDPTNLKNATFNKTLIRTKLINVH